MKFKPFFSLPRVGLDIQSSQICLVKLRPFKQTFSIECLAEYVLPQDVCVAGKILNWDKLSSLLQEIVSQQKLRGATIAINLPASLVRMQQLKLPDLLSHAEIMSEIDTLLQRDLPGMAEALLIDYAVLKNKEHHNDICFAATREAYVLQYKECLSALKLNVKIVDIDIYALSRAVCFAERLQQNLTYGILYLTKEMSYFIVCHLDAIVFFHTLDVTKDNFLSQLHDKIQMFTRLQDTVQMQKIFLCGMSCSDTYEAIQQSFLIPVCRPNVFDSMKFDSQAELQFKTIDPDKFWCASGLAMRKVSAW